MKTRYRFVITTLILLLCFDSSASSEEFTLTIRIQGFEINKGQIILSLFNSEESFLTQAQLIKTIEVGTEKVIEVQLTQLKVGTYAIAVVYDENSNNKLDTNFLGIPNEPVGVSNNAKGFLGPPSFKDAAFLLNQTKELSIHVGSAKD